MVSKLSDEQQEQLLWNSYKNDPSEENREQLIVFYLRFVRYICGRIAVELPSHIKEEDLLSSGVMGLIDAIDKYDYERENLFRTYAYNRIRGSILDELRRLDWAPRSLRKKARVIDRAEDNLQQKLGRKVSSDEVADEMGIDANEVRTVQRSAQATAILSLDEVIQLAGYDKGTKRADSVEDKKSVNPKKALERQELKELLAAQIEQLNDKEKLVIVLYYYEELTLKEIGEVLEVSESRISQLHAQAINRIVNGLKKEFEFQGRM